MELFYCWTMMSLTKNLRYYTFGDLVHFIYNPIFSLLGKIKERNNVTFLIIVI